MYINLQTYIQKPWLCIYVSDMCMSMYECVCVYVCMLCVHELCKSMYMFLGMCLSVFIHRKHMCLLHPVEDKCEEQYFQPAEAYACTWPTCSHIVCSLHGPLETGLLRIML